jgi:hypothetical protein
MTGEKILLKDLIKSAGEQLRRDFCEIQKNNPHAAESGVEAEVILKEFLKDRLPRRFDIESGLIVGIDGMVSSQTDLIIFDALNSPVYRKGPRVHILPRDNVAAVIEVKSKLNKEQLKDAAKKIASVKKIKATPITNIDQPVTFSHTIMTTTLGCVFAFDSYTSLITLADNLKEINSCCESSNWIDLVVVLDKGYIGYTIKFPFDEHSLGWFGGACVEDFPIPPCYIHLVKHESGDLTLNHFFVKLMAHLMFFRKRSSIDFGSALGPDLSQFMTIQGYQYNLNGKLVPAEESHKISKFKNPSVRFNIYTKEDKKLKGQVCFWPWQDGAVITCSTSLDHRIIFQHYFKALRVNGKIFPGGMNVNMWLSSVLPISEENFIKSSNFIHKDFTILRDTNDDKPPPFKLE